MTQGTGPAEALEWEKGAEKGEEQEEKKRKVGGSERNYICSRGYKFPRQSPLVLPAKVEVLFYSMVPDC